MTLRAAVLSTGDELTTGRIVDTNASWIADKLFEIGVELAGVLTVGDHHDRLVWAWRRALELADVVISTGGIGPTADDLTSEVVAEVVGVPLVEDAEQAARIRQLFAALGREMPANNLKQALLPRGAIVIPNALGTAPGYRLAHGAKHLVVLPGVPPSGPAIPVVDTPIDAPNARRAPAAISPAVSSLTAPCAASVSRRTPSSSCFALSAYATSAPRTYAELPGTLVSR